MQKRKFLLKANMQILVVEWNDREWNFHQSSLWFLWHNEMRACEKRPGQYGYVYMYATGNNWAILCRVWWQKIILQNSENINKRKSLPLSQTLVFLVECISNSYEQALQVLQCDWVFKQTAIPASRILQHKRTADTETNLEFLLFVFRKIEGNPIAKKTTNFHKTNFLRPKHARAWTERVPVWGRFQTIFEFIHLQTPIKTDQSNRTANQKTLKKKKNLKN